MCARLGHRRCSDIILFPSLSFVVLKCSPDAGGKKARGELQRDKRSRSTDDGRVEWESPSTESWNQVFFPVLPRSLPGLVEEDVPRLGVLGDVRGKSVKLLDSLGVNFLPNTQNVALQEAAAHAWGECKRVMHLHNVVVEQQPEAMTLHYGDVMSSVWTTGDTQTNTDSFHCATRVQASH